MKLQTMKFRYLLCLLIGSLILMGQLSSEGQSGLQLSSHGSTIILPSNEANLLKSAKTKQFIDSSRAIAKNNASSMDQIYFRLGGIITLDPTLSSLPQSTQDYWKSQVLSFQNANGGFGGWLKDTSSLSDTFKALQILSWLGDGVNSVDTALIDTYLTLLQNSLSGGYTSQLADGDTDVFSTVNGVKTYDLLGIPIPNSAVVIDVIRRSQNLGTTVPSNELGGFGRQTNNVKGIYWTSENSVSASAILGLNILGQQSTDDSSALDFVKSLQTSNGGFVNNPILLEEGITYTSSALQTIKLLGGTPLDSGVSAETYLLSLENGDGSFKPKAASFQTTLKSTYFGIIGLVAIGSQPSDNSTTLNYLVNWSDTRDGYGGFPGDIPSIRETFDAVNEMNYLGITIPNPTGIADNVASYYNPGDGGYGISGSFVDSTSRAINIYTSLGITMPNSAQTINFLQGLQRNDGGFEKKPSGGVSYIVSTYRAIVSLQLLGSQPSNPSNAVSFIKLNQNTDGGFGGFPADNSDVSSTYRGIRSLDILSDNTYDVNAAVDFLKESQNPDGGFKRSNYDNLRPKNISHAVYTYSAVRSLFILGEIPTNTYGLFDYIIGLRNNDGGYGEHAKFTSDNAYTFTSLWLLKNFNEISDYKAMIPDNLNVKRTNYDIDVEIIGGAGGYNYSLTDSSANTIVNSYQPDSGILTINMDSINPDTYNMNLTIIDRSGVKLTDTFEYIKFEDQTILSDYLLYVVAGGAAIVVVSIIWSKKRE